MVEGLLILFSWTFAAGAFWASTRAMRREISDMRQELNGMGKRIEQQGHRWRELLAVMLDNAGDSEQRARITRLLRFE